MCKLRLTWMHTKHEIEWRVKVDLEDEDDVLLAWVGSRGVAERSDSAR